MFSAFLLFVLKILKKNHL